MKEIDIDKFGVYYSTEEYIFFISGLILFKDKIDLVMKKTYSNGVLDDLISKNRSECGIRTFEGEHIFKESKKKKLPQLRSPVYSDDYNRCIYVYMFEYLKSENMHIKMPKRSDFLPRYATIHRNKDNEFVGMIVTK